MKFQTLCTQLMLIGVVMVGSSQSAQAFWGPKEPSPAKKCEEAGGVYSNGGCKNPYTGTPIYPGGLTLPKCRLINCGE
jgi:hypothetical protein